MIDVAVGILQKLKICVQLFLFRALELELFVFLGSAPCVLRLGLPLLLLHGDEIKKKELLIFKCHHKGKET